MTAAASSPSRSSPSPSSPGAGDSAAGPPPPPQAASPLRRHPRDWLEKLLLSHSPTPTPPPSDSDAAKASADAGEASASASASSASLSSSPPPPHPAHSDPRLRGKALAVAPMVDQSDLPFRLLCRRYGSNICWTPMIHAKLFVTNRGYRERFWNWGDASWDSSGDGRGGGGGEGVGGMPPEDRPLIAQFCGSDPAVMLEAMRAVESHVDGVDVNCGCPQNIARKGNYGAFLLERGDELVGLVRYLAPRLRVPLSVKVRLLPAGVPASLDLYERLVDAGAGMITVHGRNRHQKGPDTGACDWDAIRRVVERIGRRVPVLANGGIETLDDVRRCLAETGCDGVMSSEGVLEYPALFAETSTSAVDGRRAGPGRVRLAREYLDLAGRYLPDEGGQGSGLKCVRIHVHRFLHGELQSHPDLRDAVSDRNGTLRDLQKVVDAVEDLHRKEGRRVEEEGMSWYRRHRGTNAEGENVLDAKRHREKYGKVGAAEEWEDEDMAAAGCFGGALFGDADDDDGEVYGDY